MKTNNRSVIKKSLLSIFSAAAIMAGSVIPVFADTSDTANSGIFSFQKQYTYSYPSSVNSEYFSYPKEKFTFTSSQGESKAALGKISNTTLNSKKGVIEDAPSDNTTIPQYINIGSADYSTDVKKARAYVDGKFTTDDLGVQVSIPSDATYPSPGIYYYSFEEKNNNTAGIDYDYEGTKTYWIAVLVTLPETSTASGQASTTTQSSTNKPTPTSILLYKNIVTDGKNSPDLSNKISGIINRYVSGQFNVTKSVKGNLGDPDKKFKVTVTFSSNKPVRTPIIVTSNDTATSTTIKSYDSTAASNDWQAVGSTSDSYIYTGTYEVKNGITISFNNIPYGVSFNAKEDNYSDDGYTAKYYQIDQNNTKTEINADTKQEMNGAQIYNLEIVNDKQQELPTGVFTSNLPYFIILIAAAGGLVIFLASRKHRV